MATWKIQSMFSGIGGLDLGVERALDAVTVAQCEMLEYNRKVLAKHWPDAVVTDDVRTLEAADDVDVLVAGFPCKDASLAFQRGRGGMKGLEGERTGLFWEVMRIADDTQPKVIVLENVRNLLNAGFDVVLEALDARGYDVRWGVWSAAACGAPHVRERLITVAVRRDWVDIAAVTDDAFPIRDAAPRSLFADLGQLPEHDSGAWDARRAIDPEWDVQRDARRASGGDAGRRLIATGNAVAPVVAEVSVRRTLTEWPEPTREATGDKIPAWGALVDGVVYETAQLVQAADTRSPIKTGDWVRFIETSRVDGKRHHTAEQARPVVGRVVYAEDGVDVADVELPGGIVEPFDVSQLRRWWPTPTAWDVKATGCAADLARKSPGLPLYTGGVGCPTLSEWAMGLPLGWTDVD
jgi:site-specific DNA-cytosine methylase